MTGEKSMGRTARSIILYPGSRYEHAKLQRFGQAEWADDISIHRDVMK